VIEVAGRGRASASKEVPMPAPHAIVVGASAGGVEALMALVGGLREDLPAAVCVVLHQPARVPSVLPTLLRRAGRLPVDHADDHRELEAGRIYVASPDHHLTVGPGYLRVRRGPLENGHRPAIDPLFRSAAAAYGPAATAVVLSGTLDDGSAGAAAIRAREGTVVLQSTDDALYPEMVINARSVAGEPDLEGPARELGERLHERALERTSGPCGPEDLGDGEEVDAHPELVAATADPTLLEALTCPACDGPLHEEHEVGWSRFRCRVGHGWSLDALDHRSRDRVEHGLWSAVRLLEERASLSRRLLDRATHRGHERAAAGFREQITRNEAAAETVRGLVLDDAVAPSVAEHQQDTG
jgi:two-component system, chemotaxis family, protein-glutamate methylesterase/glutaminase